MGAVNYVDLIEMLDKDIGAQDMFIGWVDGKDGRVWVTSGLNI